MIARISVSAEALPLSSEALLLSLGCPVHAQTSEMRANASSAIRSARTLARPSAIGRVFPLDWQNGHPSPIGVSLSLPGDDIAAHLAGCKSCLCMAVTLGHAVERELHRLSVDPTSALYFDAACSLLVEAGADAAQESLLKDIPHRSVRFRYSPGYGDLPLSLQSELLAVLDASRHLGLTLTDSGLMLPRKSITGIVGIEA